MVTVPPRQELSTIEERAYGEDGVEPSGRKSRQR
jgi:hypothetical protein